MTSGKDVLKFFKNEGIFTSNELSISDKALRKCFKNFINQDSEYKKKYLQKNYNYAFDGYSYSGQTDSSNQAYDDMLDTFVFSDFQEIKAYPKEFHSFLIDQWHSIIAKVSSFELGILKQLKLAEHIKMQDLGHMVSANYYPPAKDLPFTGDDDTRLSAHPDVSLLTVFPFGVKEGFSYKDKNGEWVSLPENNSWTCFPGYLMEVMTNGEIKALEHRVELPINREEERFSFAFFSLPRQETSVKTKSGLIEAGQYFKMYLDLF